MSGLAAGGILDFNSHIHKGCDVTERIVYPGVFHDFNSHIHKGCDHKPPIVTVVP